MKVRKFLAVCLCGSIVFSSSIYSNAATVTVQKGDSISKFAKEYGTTIQRICDDNNISDPNKIQIGQQLYISGEQYSNLGYGMPISSEVRDMLWDMFDADYYMQKNPDVVKALGTDPDDLFRHFLHNGIYEGRQPNTDFNVSAYASAYKDLTTAFADKSAPEQIIEFYVHYQTCGKYENRSVTTIEAATERGIEVHNYSSVTYASRKEVLNPPASSPAPTETFDSIANPSIIITVRQAMDYIVRNVKPIIQAHPELVDSGSSLDIVLTNINAHPNDYHTDKAHALFCSGNNLSTYLNDSLIDSKISDTEEAAKVKAQLYKAYSPYRELATLDFNSFTEVVAYRAAFASCTLPSKSLYTYVGLTDSGVTYYVNQAACDAAYAAVGGVGTAPATYAVATYSDWNAAKDAYRTDCLAAGAPALDFISYADPAGGVSILLHAFPQVNDEDSLLKHFWPSPY